MAIKKMKTLIVGENQYEIVDEYARNLIENMGDVADCGINPVDKTDSMTQSVGVDSEGNLWTNPSETMEIEYDGNGNMVFKSIPSGSVDSVGSSSLTTTQISALDGMFKIVAYTEDATVAYNAFKLAFGIGEPSEPDVPVDPDEPDVPDEPDDNPIEPVYTLASPLTTDGATMIDTGYALADEDKDWTVVCEISGNADYGKPIWGLGNRIALWSVSAWIWYGGYAPDVYGDAGKGAVQLFTGHPKNRKVILTHNKGGNIITGYYLNNNAVASVEDSSKVYSNIVGVAETVTLGGSTDTAGDKFFAANRTIHDFKIYERVLSETEINEYLGIVADEPEEPSEPEQPDIHDGYVSDGLEFRLDAIRNTANGHDSSKNYMEDVSGNEYEIKYGGYIANIRDTYLTAADTGYQKVSHKITDYTAILGKMATFTIEVVMQPNSELKVNQPLFGVGSGQQNYLLERNGQMRLYDGSSTVYGTANTDMSTIKHYAITYDGTNMNLYHEGVLNVSQPAVIDFSTAEDCEFFANREWENYTTAYYNAARIYTRALTAEEIKTNYDNDIARFGTVNVEVV